MDALGLYISVPFCTGKCTFCNFASDVFPAGQMAGYVDRLCAEIGTSRHFAAKHDLCVPPTADSVFVGGGTPTLLQPAHIARVFAALREHFALSSDAEITVEAAPGQISDGVLDAMLACGVNRISLGVQSFVNREAKAVGRTHTGESCQGELRRLRASGVRDLSIDLIAGLPYQTEASWAESLQQTIDSGIDHVSVYMLEVDEDSRLGRELIGPGVRYGAAAAPGEALVTDLYTQACETLVSAGLRHYEISNFAREGHLSRHNRKYWTRAPYLGFGLDAHSMLLDGRGSAARFANGDELPEYLDEQEAREIESIDLLGAWEETIFLGLRLNEGLLLSGLRHQFPSPWIERLLERTRELSGAGLMLLSGDRIALTQRGRIVSSSLFGELLAGEPIDMRPIGAS